MVAAMFALAAACASSNKPADGEEPMTDEEVALAIVVQECEVLIGSVNASVNHVAQMGSQANAEGKNQFEETAKALESVVRTIASAQFTTPDLQRISGFYIGVAQAQAVVIREMDAAATAADEAALEKAMVKFEELGKQEDIVVEELNLQCRGRKGDAPAPQP